MGGAILRAAGLQGRVASNLDEYLNLARSTITAPGRVQELREWMLGQRTRAPLFDLPAFVRTLEAGYRMIVERARNGAVPVDLHVPASAYRRVPPR